MTPLWCVCCERFLLFTVLLVHSIFHQMHMFQLSSLLMTDSGRFIWFLCKNKKQNNIKSSRTHTQTESSSFIYLFITFLHLALSFICMLTVDGATIKQKNSSNNNNTYLTVACTLYGMGRTQQKLKQLRIERLLAIFLSCFSLCIRTETESTKNAASHCCHSLRTLKYKYARFSRVMMCTHIYFVCRRCRIRWQLYALRLLKFGGERIYLHTKKYTTQKPEYTHRRTRACIRAKNAREGSPIPFNWGECVVYVFAAFVCAEMCERDRTNVCVRLSKPELVNECVVFLARPWGVPCT